MQINPHFLYNTLESINWMARMKQAPEIGDMVKALGDLMRVSISGDDFIPLKDEIGNISNYLKIQKFRYGDRFEALIHIGEEVGKFMIPKLILQPIVENAIVHGLEDKIENGRIDITGMMEDGNVIIDICDDGVGMNEEKVRTINRLFAKSAEDHQNRMEPSAIPVVDPRRDAEPVNDMHMHIGLINVDRRIRLYYGSEYGLFITSAQGAGTCVRARFPLDKTPLR